MLLQLKSIVCLCFLGNHIITHTISVMTAQNLITAGKKFNVNSAYNTPVGLYHRQLRKLLDCCTLSGRRLANLNNKPQQKMPLNGQVQELD